MRFKKGSKVEILGNTEGLSVEWRCAHIISGNGHTYNVQYDCSSMTIEVSVERVPRKAIRPCPPPIEGVGSWEVNNFVEVYDAGSWKAATVLKFLGRDFYLVRLWVSCKVLKVHKVDMRVHQSWQNGQWIVKPMGPGDAEVGKSSWNLISNSSKAMPEVHQAIKVCSPGLDVSGLQEPHLTPSSTLKRGSPYGSYTKHYPRKKRAIVNKGECVRLRIISTAPLLEKVDAIAYPQYNMGEKCMHFSFNNTTKQCYEMKENPCNVTKRFLERIEEPNHSCSVQSSVCSCSVISNSVDKFFSDELAGSCQDEDTLCSDAESIDVRDVNKGCTFSPEEVVAERSHRLELHAYHSTLEAMYASGPLSWEQEELLTNLRISLSISNDEHLIGIKKLVSAGQNF